MRRNSRKINWTARVGRQRRLEKLKNATTVPYCLPVGAGERAVSMASLWAKNRTLVVTYAVEVNAQVEGSPTPVG